MKLILSFLFLFPIGLMLAQSPGMLVNTNAPLVIMQKTIILTTNAIPPPYVKASEGHPPSPVELPTGERGIWKYCPTCLAQALEYKEILFIHTNEVTTIFDSKNFHNILVPPLTNYLGYSVFRTNVVIRANPPMSIQRSVNPRTRDLTVP